MNGVPMMGNGIGNIISLPPNTQHHNNDDLGLSPIKMNPGTRKKKLSVK